jgi:hypothetical protein
MENTIKFLALSSIVVVFGGGVPGFSGGIITKERSDIEENEVEDRKAMEAEIQATIEKLENYKEPENQRARKKSLQAANQKAKKLAAEVKIELTSPPQQPTSLSPLYITKNNSFSESDESKIIQGK